ncbi:uncharacterized protein HaLaN_13579, partial [Haematococcus lacustris]
MTCCLWPPQGLALDPVASLLYVLDSQPSPSSLNGSIGVFRLAAGPGSLASLGSITTPPQPHSLTLSSNRRLLYLTTSSQDKLVQMDLAARTCTPLPLVNNTLVEPQGVVLHPNGLLYIADAGSNMLWSYNFSTTELQAVAGEVNMSQPNIAHFVRPFGVAIDSDRSLLVTDQAGCTLKRVSVPGYNDDTSYSVSYVVGEVAVASAANACGSRPSPMHLISGVVYGDVQQARGELLASQLLHPGAVQVDALGTIFVREGDGEVGGKVVQIDRSLDQVSSLPFNVSGWVVGGMALGPSSRSLFLASRTFITQNSIVPTSMIMG